jgi:hypothetical protein
MTPEEKKLLQADSNYVYTRFVNTVARNRGLEVSQVLKSANGLTFYGTDAIKAGLADSINTFQEVLAMGTATDKNVSSEPTPEQKQAAEKEAAAKLAAQQESDALKAEVKAYRDKEAKEAADKAKAECNLAVKAAFGRDASDGEVSAYQAMDDKGRASYKAILAESSKNRDQLLTKAGLTREQVNDTGLDERSTENNLVVLAARSLGFANQPK